MKKILTLALLLTAPAFAGTSTTQMVDSPPPAEPALWSWFAGASAGYLVDFEEPMYHLHVGVDTPWNVGGFDVSLFLEGGYTEKDEDFSIDFTEGGDLDFNTEVEIIPVTLNVKFERPIANNLNFYIGAGAGAAFVDFSAESLFGEVSDDDTVFAGQIFTGLVYNVSPNFEIYGGARWIYIDDSSFEEGLEFVGLDFQDDFLVEAGLRFNF